MNLSLHRQLSTYLWWFGRQILQMFFLGSGLSHLITLCGWCRAQFLTDMLAYLNVHFKLTAFYCVAAERLACLVFHEWVLEWVSVTLEV